MMVVSGEARLKYRSRGLGLSVVRAVENPITAGIAEHNSRYPTCLNPDL
jgi:hypothetical protein